MKFSPALAAALFLPVLVNAQTTTTVTVGPDTAYYPSEITGSIGTIVHFVFTDAYHSVVEGLSEDQPCTYKPGGFDSGVRVANFTYDVLIKDDEPIYFHCKIPGHCPAGMQGVINPPATENTFDTNTGPVMGVVVQRPL